MTSHASKPPGLPSTTSGCGRRALTAMLGASGPVSYTHLDVYKRQGLAVVQAIARVHGGSVSVRPRDGGGSTFQIVVPGARTAVERTP